MKTNLKPFLLSLFVLFLIVSLAGQAGALAPSANVSSTMPGSQQQIVPGMLRWPCKVTWGDAKFLTTANTAYTYTVPSWANAVMLNANNTFYVAFETQLTGVTAAIPAADVTNGSAPFQGPVYVPVTPGSTISLISPVANTIVTIVPTP